MRVPLLRMDDADTVRSALEELRSEYWSRRRRATSQLTIAANPKVIAMLADDLMKDANPKDELVDDINVPSTSVVAARIVRATVLSSQEFSANAKAWANRLPPDPVGLTEGVRVWWQQHREALEKMDFRSVLPDAVPGTLRPRFCTGSNHTPDRGHPRRLRGRHRTTLAGSSSRRHLGGFAAGRHREGWVICRREGGSEHGMAKGSDSSTDSKGRRGKL